MMIRDENVLHLFVSFPRWVTTLTTARVTRWGGMISTPDAVLQAVIKRALLGEFSDI